MAVVLLSHTQASLRSGARCQTRYSLVYFPELFYWRSFANRRNVIDAVILPIVIAAHQGLEKSLLGVRRLI